MSPGRPRDSILLTAYPDGPLLVRGNFSLTGRDGAEVPHRGRVVALCRCGKSRAKPFCDGTHKLVGFTCSEEVEQTVEVNPA
jgi:CDGSH-type Zn-finger protein